MKYRNKKTNEVGEYLGFNEKTGYHTIALDGGGQKSSTESTFKRWWVQVVEEDKKVPVSSKNKAQKKKGTKKKMEVEKLTWAELKKNFIKHNTDILNDESVGDDDLDSEITKRRLEAVIVFKDSMFNESHDEEARSYLIGSDEAVFMPRSAVDDDIRGAFVINPIDKKNGAIKMAKTGKVAKDVRLDVFPNYAKNIEYCYMK